MARIRALNLGCGNDYRPSTDEIQWVNADNGACKKDKWLDIEDIRWDFADGWFDRIDAIQVLEHISRERFVDVIRELYRVSADGAEWNIAVPHGFSDNFITDPTHKMPFSTRTFDYFVDESQLRENGLIYGWGDVHLAQVEPPAIDGNQSIIFKLRVLKRGT